MMLTRCGRLTGLSAAGVVGVVAPSAPQALGQVVGPDFPAALVGLAQLALLGVAGWILLVLLGALAHIQLPGVPRTLRSALIVPATVGVLSVVAVAGPAQADQRHDLAGLPLPDRPVATAALDATRSPQAQADSVRPPSVSTPAVSTITVQPGDTLWSIAAEGLPGHASTTQVTQAWHAWYDANRDVVGTDPHLIRPGQVLTTPDTGPTEQDAS
ncbi:LysM peptidoglycan-binding domain-containing protein [Aeromicrobium sp. CF3.5]|uniref:LysM peptidoglycan-binding domain-containing protein n=1 Tax=Aeromicrobium sp. CF3.5 TaxID=3373078 RepID=UPI003EE63403